MMVHPPSSVSFITSGSKSTGTPFGSSDFSGCLRGFFTCTPTKRKHPPHSTAVGMELRIVVVELFGLHFSSSRHEEPRSLRAWLHAPWFITNVPSASALRIQRISVMAFIVAKSEALPTSSIAIGKTYVWPSTSTV